MDHLASFRVAAERENQGRDRSGWRYSKDTRELATAFCRTERRIGRSFAAIAERLQISTLTLGRWLEEPTSLTRCSLGALLPGAYQVPAEWSDSRDPWLLETAIRPPTVPRALCARSKALSRIANGPDILLNVGRIGRFQHGSAIAVQRPPQLGTHLTPYVRYRRAKQVESIPPETERLDRRGAASPQRSGMLRRIQSMRRGGPFARRPCTRGI
jgi:hypothetical protein